MTPGVLLEVTVASERDVPGAQEGGATRLHLVSRGPSGGPVARARHRVRRLPRERPAGLRAAAPQRVVDHDRRRDDPAGRARRGLPGLRGGRGRVRLPRRRPGDRRRRRARHLADSLPNVPWTFHRAIDDALDARRAWRRVLGLPGLVNVRSAGAARGMGEGYDDLLAIVESDPAIAALVMPGGGLLAEHVPWLVRAGVRAFHLGPQVRPGGSAKAYVDAELVRSWRLLLDDAVARHLMAPDDRPAGGAIARPDVVAPGQRHVVRRAARLRARARHPRAGLRPRPLRRPGGVLRHGRRPRRRAGDLARAGRPAGRRAAAPQAGAEARDGACSGSLEDGQLPLQVGPRRCLPVLAGVRRVEQVRLVGERAQHRRAAGPEDVVGRGGRTRGGPRRRTRRTVSAGRRQDGQIGVGERAAVGVARRRAGGSR